MCDRYKTAARYCVVVIVRFSSLTEHIWPQFSRGSDPNPLWRILIELLSWQWNWVKECAVLDALHPTSRRPMRVRSVGATSCNGFHMSKALTSPVWPERLIRKIDTHGANLNGQGIFGDTFEVLQLPLGEDWNGTSNRGIDQQVLPCQWHSKVSSMKRGHISHGVLRKWTFGDADRGPQPASIIQIGGGLVKCPKYREIHCKFISDNQSPQQISSAWLTAFLDPEFHWKCSPCDFYD
jgi:hypothetical protein